MTAQPARYRKNISSAFDEEFSLEILKSSQLRTTILMGAVSLTLLVILLLSALSFESFQRSFHGNFRKFLLGIVIVISTVLIVLLIERLIIGRSIKERRRISPAWQYVSALLETSIPTIGMLMASTFLGPVYALFTPATFIYTILIVLSVLRLNQWLCIFTGAVAGVGYTTLAIVLLSRAPDSNIEPILTALPHHLFKGFLLCLSGVVAGIVTVQLKKRVVDSFAVMDERNRISRTFGEYVSPEVMEKLMTLKPDLRSEKRNVCVMFLDIRNFTSFAEDRTPEEVVQYLESLFEFMIEIVNRHHGIVNKFLGDGFMAVFGAPMSTGSDCLNGLAAAQEILTRVEAEMQQGTILPTRVGISLHSGLAVTGSIGSSSRREYTVIGDVVNLASRIEKLNKEFGSQLLISEAVWDVTANEAHTNALPMGLVPVRGRKESIKIYKVA